MKDKFLLLKEKSLAELNQARSMAQVEAWEIKYLGRKSEIAALMKGLADFSVAERPGLGKLANEVKLELEEGLIKAKAKFADSKKTVFDVTLPGTKFLKGHLHPISIVQRELEELFYSMGFMVLDGPEVESEYYNFTALNIPDWHPARDTQDTFYIVDEDDNNKLLLRTHTSPMQVRVLQKYGAPLRAVVPGRVFRYEATDASHEHTFWQMEGLVVDKNISIGNLIGVMKELLRGIFKREVEVRLRPGFFPFVEPAFELDIKCFICGGMGCSVCKQLGWVELLPCGLVHPEVIKAGGLNPKEYSGFAFGLGLSRLAMMRYKIDDIRLFLGGDLRFLRQF